MKTIRTLFLLCCFLAEVKAQDVIRDNSFLIEEAYNQEKGVIQHIQSMQSDGQLKLFSCSFTEEWPVNSEAHQVSLSVPYAFNSSNFSVGDVLLNYRYQLLSNGRLYMAPRFSFILPTGNPSLS